MIIHGLEIAGMEGKIRRMLCGRARSVQGIPRPTGSGKIQRSAGPEPESPI